MHTAYHAMLHLLKFVGVWGFLGLGGTAYGRSDKNGGKGDVWSYEPYCVSATGLSFIGKKYCVYTANTTGPTGLSIVMDPAHAREASYFLDDNPLDAFLTKRQAERLFYNQPPYEIKEIPGKGMGVVARRKIKRFETVMVDQASLAVAVDAKEAVGEDVEASLIWRAVEQLRRPEIVRDLSWKHDGAADDGGDRSKGEKGKFDENVLQTNAFASDVGGIETRTLFPLVSRINHACNPNVFVLFSTAGTSVAVKAYRDITPGEELNLSYVTVGQPLEYRKAHLARWGFKCTCSLCSLPPAEREKSDKLRAQIAGADTKILNLFEQGKHAEALKLGERLMDNIHAEGQEGYLTDQYGLLAKLYYIVGERKRAERYAKKSFEWLWSMGFMGKEGERGSGWHEWKLESFLSMIEKRIQIVGDTEHDEL